MTLKCLCRTCTRHLATSEGLAAVDVVSSATLCLICPACGGHSKFHFDTQSRVILREFTAKIKRPGALRAA